MDEVVAKSMRFKIRLTTAVVVSSFLSAGGMAEVILLMLIESTQVPIEKELCDDEVQLSNSEHHDEAYCGLEMRNLAPIVTFLTIIESPLLPI